MVVDGEEDEAEAADRGHLRCVSQDASPCCKPRRPPERWALVAVVLLAAEMVVVVVVQRLWIYNTSCAVQTRLHS